jgi:hypothetical protein
VSPGFGDRFAAGGERPTVRVEIVQAGVPLRALTVTPFARFTGDATGG